MTQIEDDDRLALRNLQKIPNIGPACARDLLRLGIRELSDLQDRDSRELYDTLGDLDGRPHDPCMLDTLSATVAYADGEPARPWWEFSRERKARERAGSPG